jgi:hypothetical protein
VELQINDDDDDDDDNNNNNNNEPLGQYMTMALVHISCNMA